MVAISTKGRGGPFLLDPAAVAAALGERAIVVTLETGDAAWAVSALLPKRMDVFGGATRVWWPGLRPSSDPRDHPVLFVWSPEEAPQTLRRLVEIVGGGTEAQASPVHHPTRTILEGTVTAIDGTTIRVEAGGEEGVVAFADERLADLARRLAPGAKVRVARAGENGRGEPAFSTQGLSGPGEGPPLADPSPPAPEPAAAPPPSLGRVLDGVVDSLNGGRIRVRVGGRRGHVKYADGSLARLAAELVSGQRIRVREVREPGSAEPSFSVRGLLREPWKRIAAHYAVGDVVRARVVRVGDTHVLVDLLPDAAARVPFHELDWTYVKDPRELYRGGETVQVKLLTLEPEVHRCTASLKQAFGAAVKPAIAAGPGEEPFLGGGDSPEAVGGNGGAAAEEALHLREELDAALEDREDLLRQRAALQEQGVALRRDLRSAEDRLRAVEERVSAGLDPVSSETSFLAAVRVEYARKFDEADRARYPLQRMRVGREFLERLRALDGVEAGKVVEVCAQVASGRAHEVRGRSVHELRSGPAGSSGRVRAADGAKAWRCAVQEGTPSARRLHWWLIPGPAGATVEFAAVVVHDEFGIPE